MHLVSLAEGHHRFLSDNLLVLNIIALTYDEKRTPDFQSSTLNKRRDQLFEAYVNIMFEHRKIKENYSPQQIINGLIWLAKYMQVNALTVFRIEQLQPNALTESKVRGLFFVLSHIVLWLLILPFFGSASGISTFFLTHSPLHALINGVLFGVTGGLALWLAHRRIFSLRYRVSLGIFAGLSLTSFVWIFVHHVLLGLAVFLITSLGITSLFKAVGSNVKDALSSIDVVEIEWSVRAGIYGFYRRIPLGVILGLAAGFAVTSLYGWAKGLLVGIELILLTSIVGGLAYGNTDFKVRDTQRPNEGTWRLLKNSLSLFFAPWHVR